MRLLQVPVADPTTEYSQMGPPSRPGSKSGPWTGQGYLPPSSVFHWGLCGPSLVWSFTLDQVILVGLHTPRLTEALHRVPPEKKDIINQQITSS